MAVCGSPNVGKSSIINALIDRKSQPIGAHPGVTRELKLSQVNEKVFVFDTPGVLVPNFTSQTLAYHLALINAIKPKLLPLQEILSYALRFIDENDFLEFKKKFNFDINNLDDTSLLMKVQVSCSWLIKDKAFLDPNFLLFLFNKITNNE